MTGVETVVLQGAHPAAPGAGVRARLAVSTWRGQPDGGVQAAYERAGTPAFRCSPLLRVVGDRGHRRVVVGQVRLWQAATHLLQLDVALQGVWSEQVDGTWQETYAGEVTAEDLRPALATPCHVVPPVGPSVDEQHAVVAVVAKAVAEGSRDAVAALRQLRYELEERLTALVRPEQASRDSDVLADLLELGIIVGRARDQAREAAREGLWCWFGDADAYQRHRRAVDPTLLTEAEPATVATRSWMRAHDAGVRQCTAAERLLHEEAEVLARVLAGASTVVVAREAEAQQRFNAGVTLAGLGLGLPALVLTLYGAERLVPVQGRRQLLALLPVVVAAGVTAFIAGRRLARGDGGRWQRHPWPSVLAVVVLMTFLLGAALLAPS